MNKTLETAVEAARGLRAKAALFAFMVMAFFSSSFAGVEELSEGVSSQIESMQSSVILVGIAIIGIAVVVGGIYLFKKLARSAG